ncbi:hypothetical protein J1C56_10625 [Aminobacter anthyllidis]|uniref:Uncharacterized protein n=1 Tax=Aminobacter anthyllidis TaxID=1035067 RepID=A0A9X1D4E2_9HYPH|nr:hypothetical protein [Aminobacter anthyllidis]MBT1156047.1 hypothetical protein [Aminobacter anthyllidis]
MPRREGNKFITKWMTFDATFPPSGDWEGTYARQFSSGKTFSDFVGMLTRIFFCMSISTVFYLKWKSASSTFDEILSVVGIFVFTTLALGLTWMVGLITSSAMLKFGKDGASKAKRSVIFFLSHIISSSVTLSITVGSLFLIERSMLR